MRSAWDIIGGVLTLAIIATVLSKPNTSGDITTAGTAFSGILTAAEAG